MLIADMRGVAPSGPSGPTLTARSWPSLATALSRCLRETDMVGWHRTDQTAGAVLTQLEADAPTARLVGDRVLGSLRASVPAPIDQALRVRIYRCGLVGDRMGFDRVFVGTAAKPEGNESVSARGIQIDGQAAPWRTRRVVSRRAGS